MHATCERCGASAPHVEPSARALCEICAPMTASAEAREAERDSVLDLQALIRSAGPVILDRGDRVSLEIVGAPHHELMARPAPLRERRRPGALWLALGAMAGVILTLSSSALLEASWSRRAADARPTAQAELSRQASDKADARPELPREPAVEPAPTPAVPSEPEAAAPAEPSPERPRATRPRPRPTPAGPATPSRGDVLAAMRSTHASVARCGDVEQIGSRVVVRVDFVGATGRVGHAQVTEGHVPPEVRSCVARAARDAAVPRFAESRFRVVYPYML